MSNRGSTAAANYDASLEDALDDDDNKSTPTFCSCYLLTPIHPEFHLNISYVGFTVNPTRRIRQHNGEIQNGAKRTRSHRPWDMIVVVHGFPSKTHALQFEYAWQHPYRSRWTKERLTQMLRGKKGLGRRQGAIPRKLMELALMLPLPQWRNLPLTINFTHASYKRLYEKYLLTHVTSIDPSHALPTQIKVHVGPLKALPSVDKNRRTIIRAVEVPCSFCNSAVREGEWVVSCPVTTEGCWSNAHMTCAANALIKQLDEASRSALIPPPSTCPVCHKNVHWCEVAATSKKVMGGLRDDGDVLSDSDDVEELVEFTEAISIAEQDEVVDSPDIIVISDSESSDFSEEEKEVIVLISSSEEEEDGEVIYE